MRSIICLAIAVLIFNTTAATAAVFHQTRPEEPQVTANSEFFTRLYKLMRELVSQRQNQQQPPVEQPPQTVPNPTPPQHDGTRIINEPPVVPGNPPPPAPNQPAEPQPPSTPEIVEVIDTPQTNAPVPPPVEIAPTNTVSDIPNAPGGVNNEPPLMPPLPPMPTVTKVMSVNESSVAKAEIQTKIASATISQSTPVAEVASLGWNEIFPAGNGFNTVQFAPSGKAGLIVWRGNSLIYRERVNGAWSETVLSSSGNTYSANPSGIEYRFQPAAILLFDAESQAHVLRQSGSSLIRHQQTGGAFEAVEEIPLPGEPELINAQFGPGDTLHIALVTGSGTVHHGLIENGHGNWATVAQTRGNPRAYLPQSFAPRYFSLAVDSRNKAHLVFTPELNLDIGPEGYTRPYSQLHYASNKTGEWRTQLVQDVADKSGDAAYGASIAIGPEDEPFIVSWYNERAGTGSAQNSRLLWHDLDGFGNWHSSVIVRDPKGYAAGDGLRGTGFAPYLRFDEQKRPHILFSDHASQHFDSGQNEYAGQIRHAYFDGREWREQLIHSQSNPLQQQIIYPAFAVRDGKLLITALERETSWENDFRRARSSYRFLILNSSY